MRRLSYSRILRLGSMAFLGMAFGGACSPRNLAVLAFQEIGGLSGVINQVLTTLGVTTA